MDTLRHNALLLIAFQQSGTPSLAVFIVENAFVERHFTGSATVVWLTLL